MHNMTTRRRFITTALVSMAAKALSQEKTLTPLNQPRGKSAKSEPVFLNDRMASAPTSKKEVTAPAESKNTAKPSKSKNPIEDMEEFRYLTQDIQRLILEKGEYTRIVNNRGDVVYRLYSGSFFGATCEINAYHGGKVIRIWPKSFSEENFCGQRSNFDPTVPEGFGFAPDSKLMATLSADERSKIEKTIKLFNRSVYIVKNFPFCAQGVDLSDGRNVSGRCSRDPLLLTSTEDIYKALQTDDSSVSSEEKELYYIFGYQTTTEVAGKANLAVGGISSGCNGYSGLLRSVVFFRGLAKYPSRGAPEPKQIQGYLEESTKILRSQCLLKSVDVLKKAITGTHPKFGKVSLEGKQILTALEIYCEREEKGIEKLNLASLKPRGDIGADKLRNKPY